jgi:hypothetical protein
MQTKHCRLARAPKYTEYLFTDNLLPTDANTNEEANDDGQQYVFDPSKSNNIFDKADNQSDE